MKSFQIIISIFIVLVCGVLSFLKPRIISNYKSESLSKLLAKYCLNVNIYVKPERRDEFIENIKNNQLNTLLNEPLAIQYTWGESTSEPNTFYFHEEYESVEGFQAHTKSEHFAKWEKFANSNPFAKPPEVMFFTTMGNDILPSK